MNSYLIGELGRERRRELRREFARGGRPRNVVRPWLARALRASGDRLFRLGVALDRPVSSAASLETTAR